MACACILGDKLPSSRRMRVVVAVMRRCNWSVDEMRNPVAAKSVSVESSTRSVANRLARTLLVTKARITWRCGPMGAVRHTAGLTSALERSSKGKGTRTTLCFVTERLPVRHGIDVFRCILQVIKSRIAGRCP